MQDSDWDDESNPGQKTIFSESKCRLNRGLLLELQLSFTIPGRRLDNFRPVAGYRYDYFFFTTHDGFQVSLTDGNADLPGDGIEFKQRFHHYYLGGVFNKRVHLQSLTSLMSGLDVECQVDYGIVNARNEDLHLLRSGERITVERTNGHCWHVRVRAALYSSANGLLGVEAAFKRMLTNGSHELTNRILNLDFSFGGSQVWSDQAYISAYAAIKF
jgi:outer membrane protease